MIRVTVWNEYKGQDTDEVKKVYPEGIHKAIEEFLKVNPDFEVRTATLDEPENGLSDEVIENTDVLLWWGHICHDQVSDEVCERVRKAVLKGMGFIPLHSSHYSKPFISLMGTSCSLKWRDHDFERLWTIMPTHPIATGVPEHVELDEEEMYGERFDIPTPDDLVFMGWFSGGELFRSGCVWNRGYGKVFYFQPGHETNKAFQNKHIQRIISNAIYFVAPDLRLEKIEAPEVRPSYEELRLEIVEYMHKEKAYTDTMPNQVIPYSLSKQLNELK